MTTTIVLFTRDLRTRDHPALHAAAQRGEVVPLFVLDDAAIASYGAANRVGFLLESLEDLRTNLRGLGGNLWIRRGDTVTETFALARAVGANSIYLSADASAFATRRLKRLTSQREFEVQVLPGIAAVEPGSLTPTGGDHYRVFTPFSRVWAAEPKRSCLTAPALQSPTTPEPGAIPSLSDLVSQQPSPDVVPGGETAGRARAASWLAEGVHQYHETRDDMGADATSRLSAYLHFGCISPIELLAETPHDAGGKEFIRQLCWRDFFLQVLAARPDYPRSDYRDIGESWLEDPDALQLWKDGMTGVPLIDAGMRQLKAEGWMHNRARLLTSSFLTRSLRVDWRHGAQHFWDLLVDGDVASNAGNWQWTAGTGNATRRAQAMNPLRQAKRFDRAGAYVRRYVPELAELETPEIHEPWRLGDEGLKLLSYPAPLVEFNGGANRPRLPRQADLFASV